MGERTDDAGSIRAAFGRRLSDTPQDSRGLEGARRFRGRVVELGRGVRFGLVRGKDGRPRLRTRSADASRLASPERRFLARAAALAVDAARELMWGDRTRAIVILAEARRLAEQSSAEPLVSAWTDIGKDVQLRSASIPTAGDGIPGSDGHRNGGGPSGRRSPSHPTTCRHDALRHVTERNASSPPSSRTTCEASRSRYRRRRHAGRDDEPTAEKICDLRFLDLFPLYFDDR